jgi:hypothetical protein
MNKVANQSESELTTSLMQFKTRDMMHNDFVCEAVRFHSQTHPHPLTLLVTEVRNKCTYSPF